MLLTPPSKGHTIHQGRFSCFFLLHNLSKGQIISQMNNNWKCWSQFACYMYHISPSACCMYHISSFACCMYHISSFACCMYHISPFACCSLHALHFCASHPLYWPSPDVQSRIRQRRYLLAPLVRRTPLNITALCDYLLGSLEAISDYY